MRATGSASATSQLWFVASKFWLLNGAKDLPGAISQKMTTAWCCSTPRRVPMWVWTMSSEPPAEPPMARQGKRPLAYQACIRKPSDADTPSQ